MFVVLQHISRSRNLTFNLRNFAAKKEVLKNFFSMSSSATGFCFKDIEGDLFSAPKDVSLAHCVAADLRMGAGIAVKFKQVYGKVDELKKQNVKSPGVAVLKDNDRFIYYLVTKNETYSKPTYQSLAGALETMRYHMKKNGVKKLAMPQIGCGLDGLRWDKVSAIIKEIFEKDDVEITRQNNVSKLAMPRIGCGIDGLEWDQVSKIIDDTFKNENVDVAIYTFVPQ